MNPIARLRQRLRDVFAWQARDRDIHDEMEFHLESLTREYMHTGMSEADARRAARRQFGNRAGLKDRGHDVRGSRLEPIVRELRHAARRLVRTPGFTFAAVVTLALAIGANAAIFTVVYRVVLNPLPYRDSARLIDVDHAAPRINVPAGMGMKRGLYHYYADRARTLESLAVYQTVNATLTGPEGPQRLRSTRTTTSLASVLGVVPAVGRWFTEEEGAPGAPPVGVISHRLWTRRFDGDPDIVGRAVTIDGVQTDVVGVMPPDYAFPEAGVDVWLPERISPSEGLGIWTHRGVARLRDGATTADVRAELDGLITDLPQAFPDDPLLEATSAEGPWGVRSAARSLQEATVGGVAGTLWLLLAAVGLVLLVAAANVANLYLVRAEGRQREVAVRRALGAGGGALARLFLAESLLLSVAAAGVGLLIAWGAVGVLVSTAPVNLPRLDEVRIDGVVVGFTLLLSVVTALAFGSMPLVGVARTAAALHDASRRSTASRSRHRARHLLMGAQVALALVLVTSAGLMIRSVGNLRAIDPGFDPTSTLTFVLGLPARDYPDRERAVAAHQAILDRIAAVPGVTAASASTCLPLDGNCFGNGVVVEGQVFAEERDAEASTFQGGVAYRAVAGGFFETMGIRLLRGRTIQRGDVDRREPVVVVDERFADLVLPNEDPIGQRVSWSIPPAQPGEAPRWTWLEIVGIVASTPTQALGAPDPIPQLYMPMSMAGRFGAPPWEYIGPTASSMAYVVRTTTLSAGLMPSVRRAIDEVDPNLAMAIVSTLEERLDRASAPLAFTMALVTIAAMVGLLLGLVGIYAVIAYIVRQRTGEIGVRLALGAEPKSVASLITRQGAVVTLAGTTIGLAAALAGGRFLESTLFGVGSRDPGVLASATIATVALALLACWLPARRAAAVSPVEALRSE